MSRLIQGSLPDRMDAAADTLCEVTVRYDNPSMNRDPEFQDWRPVNLRSVASMWRLEDKARETLCDELAEAMRVAGAHDPYSPLRIVAATLLQFYNITPRVQPTVITAGGPDQ